MSNGIELLVLLAAIAAIIVLVPIVVVWAFATLTHTPFILDFWTWLAGLAFVLLFGASTIVDR